MFHFFIFLSFLNAKPQVSLRFLPYIAVFVVLCCVRPVRHRMHGPSFLLNAVFWASYIPEGCLLQIAFYRTILFYSVLITVIRMMGKRQIGQMEPSEFVVTMLVANLASIPMENTDAPIYSGLLPILTVLVMELLLSHLSMKSLFLRRLLCGKPVILIENGKILRENLRRTRVTLDELTGHLREKDVLDLGAVQYAILETNGNLSVFPFPGEKPASARDAGIKAGKQYLPITLISDGKVMRQNLQKTGKDRKWLEKQLKKQNATLKDTLLMTFTGGDNVQFYRKE